MKCPLSKGEFTSTLLQVVLCALLALPAVWSAPAPGRQTPKAAQRVHQENRATTRNPHGPTLTIPCDNCHKVSAWRPIKANPEFDHDKTRYPLRGMHEKVECTQCHVKPVFTDVGRNCQDCHADVHQRRMGTNCAQCHTVQGWNVAVQQVKDHQNRFPLLGAHAALQCEDCHKRAAVGQFQGLSTACISCHQTDFQKTSNPNHVTSKFPQNYEMCHTFDSWLGATFNHAGPPANFALAGAHATVACTSCHIGGVFTNFKGRVSSPTDCGNSLCHLSTWQQTNNPKHSTSPAVFPIANCATCHNTTAWTTAIFDHSTTGFPLTNSHQMAPAGKVSACTDCDGNNNYNLTIQPTDCGNSGCHLTTWQQTNNPTHSTGGTAFAAANCSTCHNTTTWTTAIFDHSTSGWPLTGSHQMAPAGKANACTDCHVNNNYNLTSANTDCYGCHQAAWNSTPTFGGNVPNHITAGFPTSLCSTCHDTVVWSDGKFDHTATGFPLQGPHMLRPRTTVTGAVGSMVNACTDCHIGANYTTGYPTTDCYGCHQTYFVNAQTYGTNVPNHVTANYPTTCVSCHTTWVTTAWLGAVFNHTYFRIPHNGSSCSDCHINSTNYAIFSCISACHTGNSPHTNQTNTNSQHGGVSGYTYNATICVNCHKG